MVLIKKSIKRIFLFSMLIFGFISHAQETIIVGRETSKTGPMKVEGKIADSFSNEPLPGVNIVIENLQTGTFTNEDGRLTLMLDKGNYAVLISLTGYVQKRVLLDVRSDGSFSLKLKEDQRVLDEVIITGYDATQNLRSTDIGKIQLSASTLAAMAPFLGEVDIIKSVTLLPGVSTVGEASSGFNVRGGGADQNLILLGGAPVYNPSHLFGFLTAFNADVVNGLTLHKGGIPAKFGGRGSSIMDVIYKKGSFDKWNGEVSLGTLSSKGTVEGPIIKDKVSLLLSGRTSHLNWMIDAFKSPSVRSSSASFYDGNILLSANVNAANSILYSYYGSFDSFQVESDTLLGWKNQIHTFQWNGQLSKNVLVDLELYNSRYGFNIENNSGVNEFNLESGIEDLGGRFNLGFKIGKLDQVDVGVQAKVVTINPGDLIPLGNTSINPKQLEKERGTESSIYFQHSIDLFKKFTLGYGLRYDLYNYVGEKTINEYNPNLPRTEESIINQNFFSAGELIQSYEGWSPRLSLRYELNSSSSLKIGYNRMNQFIHLISNTSTIAPTDVWKLSDPFLKPQIVTQYAVGFFKNLKNNNFETSLEVYYKDLQNIVEYKNGADLILKDYLETELLSGSGRTYGVEVFIKKNSGRLTGWAGYTYSRSLRRVVTPFENEQVNKGDWFPSNFDKPHDFTFVTIYKISKNTSFSSNFTYSTGRPVTLPQAKFEYNGSSVAYFLDRNTSRIPDYHRLDVSLKFKFPSAAKLWSGDWTLSVINLYARKNAFSVFFDDVFGSPPQAYRLAIIGVPIPSLTYSFKF